MKKTTVFAVVMLIAMPLASFAKPEAIAIKNSARNQKERMARRNLERLDLGQIQDPAAKKAIREILNYLNLSTQTEAQP